MSDVSTILVSGLFHLSVPSSQALMSVKGNFINRLSSCEHQSKCVLPHSPTDGCGVTPIEGRSMCIDPCLGKSH